VRGIATRALVPADAGACAALSRAELREGWGDESLAISIALGVFGEVACDGAGRIVGMALLRTAGGEAELLQVAVASSMQRQGMGSLLVARALELARARGCDVAFLEVRPSNAAARALYERAGFRAAGFRAKYYQDGEDALVMRCELRGALG